jgi:hypothetical protein
MVSTLTAFTLLTTNVTLAQESSNHLATANTAPIVAANTNCKSETNHLKSNKVGVNSSTVIVTVKVCGHLKKSGSNNSQDSVSTTNNETCASPTVASKSMALIGLRLHINSVVDTYKLGCGKGKGAFVEGTINPGSGSNNFIVATIYGLDSYSSPLYCDPFWDYCDFQSNGQPTSGISYLSAQLDYNNAGQYTDGQCY